MNKKLLSGSFWMSFGSIISRVLGVVYLIPWLMMIGSAQNIDAAQALFNTAYTPYALFISLGTAGFPSAIARRVSTYNNQGHYDESKRLFRFTFILMIISGIICGILMYALAPLIAASSPVVSKSSAILAVRMVVPAIIIIPSMSILRGWFQGNQDLKPFGISQLIEQFVRVLFILAVTYFVIEVLKMNFIVGVQLSVFAAFIGEIASYLYLLRYYHQHKNDNFPLDNNLPTAKSINHQKLALTIAMESLPFLLIGAGTTIMQLIDQFFFKQIMEGPLHLSSVVTQTTFTMFSANPAKITTVVISLALSIPETSLPLLAAEQGNGPAAVRKTLLQNLNYLLYILLPAVIILYTIAYEVYLVFFSPSHIGSSFLQANLIQSLLVALTINGLTIMQALHNSKQAVKYLVIGLVVKLVFQYPLVFWMQGMGAIIATDIAFLVVATLVYTNLQHAYHLDYRQMAPIFIVNIIFALIILAMHQLANLVLIPDGKVLAFLEAGIFGGLAIMLYIILSDMLGASRRIFGCNIISQLRTILLR
ncbi:putative polysaccharide biosynthesis protein [Limosilactobacillus caccae]|uniref:putative polysaccharide biosynthesis protein n=1 Tax=Limosilactobacillus caccae TaxID=1926284 RepID=UPI0009702FFC|nr:polysaccharide biosynthesis protein [Limosilactobacillus caccae]